MSDVFTIGDRNYRFVPDSSFGTCEKCVFRKKPHSCKASDLFDSGVLPQCDADGIGEGYFIEINKDSSTECVPVDGESKTVDYYKTNVKRGDKLDFGVRGVFSINSVHEAGVSGFWESDDFAGERQILDWDTVAKRQAVIYKEVNFSKVSEFSDGHHTFNELYHHRAVLFSVICSVYRCRCWKSKQHHDGTMYDGMFIVGVDTPKGQATYHYDVDPYWDMFDVKELDRAPEWDGHTPDQAIERIGSLITCGGYEKVGEESDA